MDKYTLFVIGFIVYGLLCFHYGYKIGIKSRKEEIINNLGTDDFLKYKNREVSSRYFGG